MTTPRTSGPSDRPVGKRSEVMTVQAQLELIASADNLAFLCRYLRAAHPEISSHDAEDIAAGVLTRLVDRVRSSDWVPQPDRKMLQSYLRTAANWAVIDSFRLARRAHEQPLPPELMRDLVLTDDETAAALDHAATAKAVRAALRRIQQDGDATLFRIVTYLLDELQRTGARPSNRQIATAVGLSHTAVANALVRVRPYFEGVHKLAEPDYHS
jgi:DNA-directed RNA polymerase specialized sigma24 family protein